ncbi:hypothetical protein GCM10022245_40230 [Streptomyces mayteni]
MDCGALAAGGDQVRPAQDGELLGGGRRLDADLREHLGDRVLADAQQFQDPDADRMAECLEELGLQLVQRWAQWGALRPRGRGRLVRARSGHPDPPTVSSSRRPVLMPPPFRTHLDLHKCRFLQVVNTRGPVVGAPHSGRVMSGHAGWGGVKRIGGGGRWDRRRVLPGITRAG